MVSFGVHTSVDYYSDFSIDGIIKELCCYLIFRGDEKPGAHSNADIAVSNRYVNDQRACQSDTQKKTGAPKKAEAQEKCGKPGVSWAASGFLNRKHPARKNTP